MKKVLVLLATVLLVTVLIAPGSSAQEKKGETVITGGLGLGYPGVYGSSGMPPIFISVDHAVVPKISIGGIVSYSTSSYSFTDDKWSYSYIFIGARGAYHWGEVLKDVKNIDLYAGATLGYHIVSAKFSGKDEKLHPYSAGGSFFGGGFYVGGRYYFSPKWAATAELGYDIGFLKIGISYKL
jgi:hypothetical protein